MKLDPQIAEICRKVKITDYLASKGVELIHGGNRWRCKCPLPGHDDHDPSFYIRTMPDGAELFRCFGCGRGGSVLTLIAEMEKTGKGIVIKRLAAQVGMVLSKFDPGIMTEPLAEDIDHVFCEEQNILTNIARSAIKFMRSNPTEDAVNKISRMYEMLDKMTKMGELDKMGDWRSIFVQTIGGYKGHGDGI